VGCCLLVALLVSGWVMRGIRNIGFSGDLVKASTEVRSLPAFELPVPESSVDRAYLGLSGTGSFTPAQVHGRVLIIEVFDFYCPHCQAVAPLMDEVYRQIEGSESLRGKIKIIGIGIGDTTDEVRRFKEKYRVPFPLFADRDRRASGGLVFLGTPTFIAARIHADGPAERFYLHPGAFEHASQFLAEIVKGSGIAQERGHASASPPGA